LIVHKNLSNAHLVRKPFLKVLEKGLVLKSSFLYSKVYFSNNSVIKNRDARRPQTIPMLSICGISTGLIIVDVLEL
jgi:hypothetical protein